MIPKFCILHHSDIEHNGEDQWDRINEEHKRRNYPRSSLGYHIGYTFIVEETGIVKRARRIDENQYHAVNCGTCEADHTGLPAGTLNKFSIGICLAGDFTRHNPKELQIRALRGLLDDLFRLHHLGWDDVLLHSETKQTACPGINLREMAQNYIPQWIDWKVGDSSRAESQIRRLKNAIDRSKGSRRERILAILKRLYKRISG